MWLVSDECTRVGRETKRLWNSCQARVLQNGLLTAFSIPLHHSSWTLPLISSPALPIPFLCLLSPPPPPTPPALFVAEEDAQSVGGILQTTQPLQPGWTGPLPGSFSRDGPENQRHTGICAHTCKTGPGETSQSVTTHFSGKKKNPFYSTFISPAEVFRWMPAYSLHTTITPCYAWHCLSLIRLVGCLAPPVPRKGSQANIHRVFVPGCYGGVKDATLTLQSIRSLIRSQADVMDGASAWVPMQWVCFRG